MFKDQTYKTPRTFDKPVDNLPSWARPAGGFNGMALYYGMVKCIDDNVGKILKVLRADGDNTIVVFTADHGDLRGEHHRQNKGVPFEGSAKVPSVIYYPGKIKGGTVINETLGCVDFLPTILSLMGTGTAGKEQGRDASRLFTEGKAPADWQDITFIRSTGGQGIWLAAISDRYKLIFSGQDDPWLFDLDKDTDELVNAFCKADYRETVRTLSQQLLAYGKKYKDPYVKDAKIKADLAWAIDGTGPYVPGATQKAAPPPTRKRRARKSTRKKQS